MVGMTKRAGAILVVDAKGGNEAASEVRAGERSAHDGVAIVERRIDSLRVAVAAKVFAEQQRPVALRALRLEIVGIAGPHALRHRGEAVRFGTEMIEHAPLLPELGRHQRAPNLL